MLESLFNLWKAKPSEAATHREGGLKVGRSWFIRVVRRRPSDRNSLFSKRKKRAREKLKPAFFSPHKRPITASDGPP